jgi:hypothetical protein
VGYSINGEVEFKKVDRTVFTFINDIIEIHDQEAVLRLDFSDIIKETCRTIKFGNIDVEISEYCPKNRNEFIIDFSIYNGYNFRFLYDPSMKRTKCVICKHGFLLGHFETSWGSSHKNKTGEREWKSKKAEIQAFSFPLELFSF